MEIDLCAVDGVPENGMRQFDLDGIAVLVCRRGESLHAVNGVCPHRGAQLGQGTLDGTSVVCPWHDWAFDIETGCGITNPMSNIAKYEVAKKNGRIVVTLPDK